MIEVQGKQIATAKILIKNLFADDMWYNIPNYQRPYVWGEEQISTLLDDVSYAAKNTPESQYFLGSVVLHCQKQKNGAIPFIENSILDGQQRLTTLYLIHAVIRDLTDKKKRKESCGKVIFQEGDHDDGIPERVRLEFSIREDVAKFIEAFIKPVDGTSKVEELKVLAQKSKSVSIKNMANAVLIIRKWFQKAGNLGIDKFYPYLRNFVIMVYVASSELEDAFRLFTVLNDRGIKLRNSDILKALNLKEVKDSKWEKKYAKYWEQLEGELGEGFDQFLSYIRTILVKEKARHNLLKEFEDNIYNPQSYDASTKTYSPKEPLLKKGKETFEYIKKYKDHYDRIFSSDNYDLTNNWAFDNLIAVLEDTAPSDIWIPPILAFRGAFEEEKIYEFLIKLDNKFSADWICRATPTTRIEGMNQIIKAIEKIAENDSISKADKIKVLLESDVFNFDFDYLLEIIDDSYIYRKRYDRYLLRKIDFLTDSPIFNEKRNSYNTMSVEHILPQNPSEDSQWLKDFTETEREEWTNALGNLVLISRRKNSSQGRLDFTDKKRKYFENSIETYPNSLKVMTYSSWSMEELSNHHDEVLGLLEIHYSK